MTCDVHENGLNVNNASLASMLYPYGEDDVTQSASLDELARGSDRSSAGMENQDEVERDTVD